MRAPAHARCGPALRRFAAVSRPRASTPRRSRTYGLPTSLRQTGSMSGRTPRKESPGETKNPDERWRCCSSPARSPAAVRLSRARRRRTRPPPEFDPIDARRPQRRRRRRRPDDPVDDEQCRRPSSSGQQRRSGTEVPDARGPLPRETLRHRHRQLDHRFELRPRLTPRPTAPEQALPRRHGRPAGEAPPPACRPAGGRGRGAIRTCRTLRIPSWRSISSNASLTSSSGIRWEMNGATSSLPSSASSTSSGTWSRPLTPPNDEPHDPPAGDQVAGDDVERLAPAGDAAHRRQTPAHPRRLDRLAHHRDEPGRLEGVVGAEPARLVEDPLRRPPGRRSTSRSRPGRWRASSRSADMSTQMIRSAPCRRQPATAPRPTMPAPNTTHVEPGCTFAVFIAAPRPVERPQANSAAHSAGRLGRDLRERDLRHHRVLRERARPHEVADLARRRGTGASCRREGSPGSAARGSRGRGSCGLLRQCSHSRHWGENRVTTRSPGATLVTPSPTRSTMPGALVPEHRRRVAGRVGARGGVHVGVADAARLEADEHLAGLRLGEVDLGDAQRLAELLEHGGFDLHGRCLLSQVNGRRAVAYSGVARGAGLGVGCWACLGRREVGADVARDAARGPFSSLSSRPWQPSGRPRGGGGSDRVEHAG